MSRPGKTAPITDLPGGQRTPSGVLGRPATEATAQPAAGIRQVNGIIGGTSPAGHPNPAGHQDPPADQRTPRVNPVGGVIGRPPAPPRHDDHPHPRRPAHDDPWETGTGVNPVLSPPPETPVDPGPALGHPRNPGQNG